jgi:hypothetical protein
MSECRFTYERARRGYDAAFVDALAEHIVEAIARASIVSDEPRVMAIRSTETVEALTRVLCTIAATNPDFDQPSKLRLFAEGLARRVCRSIGAFRANPPPAAERVFGFRKGGRA